MSASCVPAGVGVIRVPDPVGSVVLLPVPEPPDPAAAGAFVLADQAGGRVPFRPGRWRDGSPRPGGADVAPAGRDGTAARPALGRLAALLAAALPDPAAAAAALLDRFGHL